MNMPTAEIVPLSQVTPVASVVLLIEIATISDLIKHAVKYQKPCCVPELQNSNHHKMQKYEIAIHN